MKKKVEEINRNESTGVISNFAGSYPLQLLSTAEYVAQMQEELETMQPQLVEAQKETEVTMEKIAVDSVSVAKC